jgi:hypothetical protein
MIFEQPTLLPPDDLPLPGANGMQVRTVRDCHLLAHNVAPDGKADPISGEVPFFVFLYQHGDVFYQVQGLNPEMMSAQLIPPSEADRLLELLPYRAS